MRYFRERPCIKWVLLTAFLEIYWLIEWKVVLITVPHQTKKYFFCKVKKINAPGVSAAEIFYVYSKQSNSNPNQSEKYPENTEVSKKEIDDCHSVRRPHRITKRFNRKCSTNWFFLKIQENFQENNRGSIFLFIFLTKILHQGCFLWDFLRYFRTPHDGCFWNYFFWK